MRQQRATVAAGTIRTSALGVRHLLIALAAAVALAWLGVAFAQEAYISHRLSQQVADLRRQNLQLSAQNAGYQKDVQALQSGSADEEVARLNGYAKPNERLYLVTTQASPSPSPSASKSH